MTLSDFSTCPVLLRCIAFYELNCSSLQTPLAKWMWATQEAGFTLLTCGLKHDTQQTLSCCFFYTKICKHPKNVIRNKDSCCVYFPFYFPGNLFFFSETDNNQFAKLVKHICVSCDSTEASLPTLLH